MANFSISDFELIFLEFMSNSLLLYLIKIELGRISARCLTNITNIHAHYTRA
jgi:hypothetical protein